MIKVFQEAEALALAAAKAFVFQSKKAVAHTGRFTVVLSGGSTPTATFKLLATEAFKVQIDWSKVHVFWGDERCVSLDDSKSNYHGAWEHLLSRVPIPRSQIHPMFQTHDPAEAAIKYEAILRDHFDGLTPGFDLVLLGLGLDGHTASLFAGSQTLNQKSQWVMSTQKDAESFHRLTLSPFLLNQTKMALFLVTGEEKTSILQSALAPNAEHNTIPAHLIHPDQGDLNWFVDRAAYGSGSMKRNVQISPSILAADFGHLGDQVDEATRCGAHRLHVDVMDGHFVPNLSMGPALVRSLRKQTHLRLDTHLMISDPDLFVDMFAEAGSDCLLVHVEGNNNLHRTLQKIRALGKRVGVVLNPATPAFLLEDILEDLDQVLVMTVNPGFGTQAFIPSCLTKIRAIRELIEDRNSLCELAVDGGINAETAGWAVEAGADILVAGSSIFNESYSISLGMRQLRDAIQKSAQ